MSRLFLGTRPGADGRVVASNEALSSSVNRARCRVVLALFVLARGRAKGTVAV